MIRIRLQVGRVGPQGIFGPGDEIDVPEAEALALINTQQAERADTATAPESATISPAEAAIRRPRGRPRKARKNGPPTQNSPD